MKKIKCLTYNIYKTNKDNFIGQSLRWLRNSLYSLDKSNFEGTKDDLRYIRGGKGPFDKTKRIAFELSNLCNYSDIHAGKCPISEIKGKKILSEEIVYQVLKSCQKYDYRGYIAFDVYNEPLIDPRLMMFIKKTKEMLPKATVVIQSNGFYFDQTLANELEKNGVGLIRVSAYTPEEKERLEQIKLNIPYKVTPIILDGRIEIYAESEKNLNKPCLAPLNEILVTHDAKVLLCCWDWKRQNVFGDLKQQSLEEILLSPKIRETYERLSKGDRFLDICKRCVHSR